MKMKKDEVALSARRKLPSCLFSFHVPCLFRKSEKSGIMRRCSGCGHYKRFVEEMEREEGEFWNEVDELRSKDFRCYCDGKLCGNEPVRSCFGVKVDSGEVFRCSRFDANRLPDGSLIKKEFLRLSGDDSAES